MGNRKRKSEGWVAFLDLLGTKESSRRSRASLGEVLRLLSDHVVALRSSLGPNSKLFHFSDCVFLEIGTDDLDILGFFEWLVKIQWMLYSKGHYFKCAVVPGELSVQNYSDFAERDRFSSVGFMDSTAVRAYELHEAFKGIGVVFDHEIAQTTSRRRIQPTNGNTYSIAHCFVDGYLSPFVQSFYVSDARGGVIEARPYWDFRLHPKMLVPVPKKNPSNDVPVDLFPETLDPELNEPDSFREIMRQFAKANLKSEKYGRYYMSLLCTAVSSSDFSRIDVVSAHSGNGFDIVNAPLIFGRLFGKATVIGEIKNIPGFPFLIFRLIDELLSGIGSPEKKIQAGKFIGLALADYKEIFRFLGSADACIINELNREIILDAVGENIS